jgi:serine/threonine protein phosphatase PrpC
MGTTITACLVKDKEMVAANVGDSRCYIIKENKVSKITKDHSLVQQLLDEGSINAEEAELFPNKNIITRALGVSINLEIDTYKVGLDGVNKVVLTTDGLTNFINEEDMYEIIMSNDNTEACRKLVKLSLDNGSRDNVSVIIFEGEK